MKTTGTRDNAAPLSRRAVRVEKSKVCWRKCFYDLLRKAVTANSNLHSERQ